MLKIQNNTLQDWGKLDNLPADFNWVLATKQDKETWKGLSTNDFSNTDKTKLDWLSNYTLPTASDSVLWWVKVDWTSITIIDWVISSTWWWSGGEIDWWNSLTETFALEIDWWNSL